MILEIPRWNIQVVNFEAKLTHLWVDKDYQGDRFLVQAQIAARERDTGAPQPVRCGRAIRATDSTPEVEVRRLLQDLLLHELDECLYVNGVRVFDPHANGE